MKLKKISAAALALIMVLAMSACSGGDEPSEQDIENRLEQLDKMPEEEAEKEIEKGLEALDETTAATTTAAEAESTIVPTDKILSADVYSGEIEIWVGNSVLDKSTYTVSELAEAGAEISPDPETTVLEAGKSKEFDITLGGASCSYTVRNSAKERVLLKDCTVNAANLKTATCVYPKGIMVGSTLDELLAAYGEPYYLDIDTYYYAEEVVTSEAAEEYGIRIKADEHGGEQYYVSGVNYVIQVDLETKKVKNIVYDFPNKGEASYEGFGNSEDLIIYYSYLYKFRNAYSELINIVDAGENKILIQSYDEPSGSLSGSFFYKYEYPDYSDESLSAFCESKSDQDCFSSYKSNGDTAVAVRVKKVNYFYQVVVYCLNENLEYLEWDFVIFPCNGNTEITEADLENVYPVFFELGETVHVEAK